MPPISRRRFFFLTLLSTVGLLLACGESESGGACDPVPPPTSVDGRTYRMEITSGSGVFAARGTGTVSFGAVAYAIQGDGVDTASSSGTYTYQVVGELGTATLFDDILGGPNVFSFTFCTATSGTYSGTAAAGGAQAGRFREI